MIILDNVCINNTVINETTKYVNVTLPCNCTNETIYVGEDCRWDDDYVLELIRRIGYLEGKDDDKYINLSCEDELDDCFDELYDCNETLEDLKDVLEE